MAITFDPAKRNWTLRERGLDFAQTGEVFAGPTVAFQDTRADYGEVRWVTVGFLQGRMVFVVWTPRGDVRHIISLRKCNDREQARYGPALA